MLGSKIQLVVYCKYIKEKESRVKLNALQNKPVRTGINFQSFMKYGYTFNKLKNQQPLTSQTILNGLTKMQVVETSDQPTDNMYLFSDIDLKDIYRMVKTKEDDDKMSRLEASNFI